MGELARKFTIFSTSDSLLRVLKSKGLSPELKKITRQDKLSLFSSLDGYGIIYFHLEFTLQNLMHLTHH